MKKYPFLLAFVVAGIMAVFSKELAVAFAGTLMGVSFYNEVMANKDNGREAPVSSMEHKK
jgi:hypothetical protein